MLLLIQPDQLKVRFSKKLKRNKNEDQGYTEGEWGVTHRCSSRLKTHRTQK
jgi:hypothetical protein